MEVIINGVLQRINLNNKIGEGTEGKVYLSNNNTYKIYYPNTLYDGFELKEKHHSYLLNIETKQIILPTELIYSKYGRYIGYTAPPIKKKRNKLIDIETKTFIKNLKILERDIELLATNKVLMADVKYYNFIYNGNMYIIDPGRYKPRFDIDPKTIYDLNINQYKKLLIYLIENEMYSDNFCHCKVEKTINLIKHEMLYQVSEYFKNEMKKYDTLKEYVKHKH